MAGEPLPGSDPKQEAVLATAAALGIKDKQYSLRGLSDIVSSVPDDSLRTYAANIQKLRKGQTGPLSPDQVEAAAKNISGPEQKMDGLHWMAKMLGDMARHPPAQAANPAAGAESGRADASPPAVHKNSPPANAETVSSGPVQPGKPADAAPPAQRPPNDSIPANAHRQDSPPRMVSVAPGGNLSGASRHELDTEIARYEKLRGQGAVHEFSIVAHKGMHDPAANAVKNYVEQKLRGDGVQERPGEVRVIPDSQVPMSSERPKNWPKP